MGDRRLTTLLGNRPRLLTAVGIGLAALVAIGLFVAFVLVPVPAPQPVSTSTEPAPQAPLSIVEPTLVAPPASNATPAIVPEPSPFAGIAELPAAPPHRTGLVHHVVTPGEVLWQIAEDYQLRPETLIWANNIEDADLLLVGQDLAIPPADGVLYTVKPGDRLSDVVNRYGVDLQAVIGSNTLVDVDQIQAGVDLFLPGARPLAPSADGIVSDNQPDSQEAATGFPPVALPANIDALLGAGWLTTPQGAELFKTAERNSSKLHELPAGVRLERMDGFRGGRIQVRDPGDGRTRQAMTGWVQASDLDVARAPVTRELPLAYPADTAMDIAHVFAPYRSQLDGSPFAEANCGPTAVGMALDAFGVSVPPRQLRAAALDAQHMYGNGVGTLITALAQVVEQNGLSALDLRDDSGALHRWSLDDVRDQINQGHPVIVQVRYRSLPGRGGAYYFGDHYILVTGVVGDGFLYNDPIDVDGLGWDRVISGATLNVAMNASAGGYAHTAFAVGR
jgi:LysM repeat protein